MLQDPDWENNNSSLRILSAMVVLDELRKRGVDVVTLMRTRRNQYERLLKHLRAEKTDDIIDDE
jgi:putative N-acetylmannosamine-6-phosphate epimerase